MLQVSSENNQLKIVTNGTIEYFDFTDIKSINRYIIGGHYVLINFYPDISNDFNKDSIKINIALVDNQAGWTVNVVGVDQAVTDISSWKADAIAGSIFDATDVEGTGFTTDGQVLIWSQTNGQFEAGTISSSNIGNSDLTIDDATRKLQMNANTASETYGIYNNAGTTAHHTWYGDGNQRINGNIGINNAVNSSYYMFILNNVVDKEGIGIQMTANSTRGVVITSSTGTNNVLADLTNTTSLAGTHRGIRLNVANATTANYAFDITAGDYKISHTGAHKMILGGALTTDSFVIRNSADSSDYFKVNGTGLTEMFKSAIFQNVGGTVNGVTKTYSSGNNSASSYWYNNSSVLNVEFRDESGSAQVKLYNSSGLQVYNWSTANKTMFMGRTGAYRNQLGGTSNSDYWSVINNGYSTEYLKVTGLGNVTTGTPSLATTATDGFLYVPSCDGTPTGTPTTFTGMVPIVADSTNNKLYMYSGGAWVALN